MGKKELALGDSIAGPWYYFCNTKFAENLRWNTKGSVSVFDVEFEYYNQLEEKGRQEYWERRRRERQPTNKEREIASKLLWS